MTALSSNHFSVDLQTMDALSYLETTHPEVYGTIKKSFPEIDSIIFEGAWMDTKSMGVDDEWPCWLVDEIESTGLVMWVEGEPYTADSDDEETE